ncbi:hypothetical protein F7725_020830 [Dissostichus mawsoni]|uniref:Trafficking protein particle complex subunit 6B n=1 Tax=Dissostichus mawsoni TaxID=36200 RepID=A0A7J5YEA7_DISMA|nr:hypothetical protein F7725_020830 [Dissostichus mawsoni]
MELGGVNDSICEESHHTIKDLSASFLGAQPVTILPNLDRWKGDPEHMLGLTVFLTLWPVCGTGPVFHYGLDIRMVSHYDKRRKVSPENLSALLAQRGGSARLLLLILTRGTLNRISSATQETSFCLLRVAYTQLTGMADESLFDFLHMEIVSHMYTEQQSSKGEMDNKDRAVCVSVLESMGFRVGQGIIERLTRDSPSFKDELDVMKFVCKDFWTKVFRRQVDNLRTNHQGTYVLQDNKFSFLTQLSSGKQYLDQAPKYLAFSCGVVRGALSNLGMDSVVTAEVSSKWWSRSCDLILCATLEQINRALKASVNP